VAPQIQHGELRQRRQTWRGEQTLQIAITHREARSSRTLHILEAIVANIQLLEFGAVREPGADGHQPIALQTAIQGITMRTRTTHMSALTLAYLILERFVNFSKPSNFVSLLRL
jgi:3-dehydroquinate dehydratase